MVTFEITKYQSRHFWKFDTHYKLDLYQIIPGLLEVVPTDLINGSVI